LREIFTFKGLVLTIGLLSYGVLAQANQEYFPDQFFDEPDLNEDIFSEGIHPLACRPANARQIAEVNSGNKKAEEFLNYCEIRTSNSHWCSQVIRPNPESRSIFRCTYGASQPHQLIHPDESTWENAIKAIELVQRLEMKDIRVCLIYNWWRPEPYNGNVGGAAGRHPFGTSVDVRFCSMQDMEKAFRQLCIWRKEGHLRALGYYGSTGLHLGIADRTANTWGKSCN
jgi:hypothetical protein